jgi:hypothetical protein
MSDCFFLKSYFLTFYVDLLLFKAIFQFCASGPEVKIDVKWRRLAVKLRLLDSQYLVFYRCVDILRRSVTVYELLVIFTVVQTRRKCNS